MLYHLRQKPLVKNVPRYALSSADLIDIQSKALYWRPRTSKRHIILTALKISLNILKKRFEEIF